MSELVEQVARAIHDVLENDDDSKGGGYMRAARAALSVLEPRIEALERELAEAVAVERFCRECGASVAVDPSFMACHCRTMIWPIRNGERG
jgi:transcription elongation GreA/GreB family factor